MAEAKASGFAGYAENWLFAMTEHEEPEKIDKIDYLGLTAYVTVQEDLHKVCGKRWYSYEVMTEDLSTCLAICGYKFEE